MPLNKPGLQADIDKMLNDLLGFDGSSGKTQADSINKFKNDLADAIDTFVKTGTVTVTVTSVTGVTTGAGTSGPGTGTGTIS